MLNCVYIHNIALFCQNVNPLHMDVDLFSHTCYYLTKGVITMDLPMNVLYTRIRKLREEKGFSQDELASLTGYTSRTSIAKIETGKVDLSISKIAIFAKALGTTSSYLLGWDWDAVDMTLTNTESNVIHAYRKHQEQQYVVNLILDISTNLHPEHEYLHPALIALNEKYLALDQKGRDAMDFMMENEYVRICKPKS